jgi:hypothetical protein
MGILACGLLLISPVAAGSKETTGPGKRPVVPMSSAATIDQLLRMPPAALQDLYRRAPAAPVPSGRVRGTAIVRPGSRVGPAFSRAAKVVWQGKVFHDDATVTNRFFGLPAIKARVGYGPSWLDGAPSLILDYQDTSHVYARNRDEIRQVAPGLCLGIMYERTSPSPTVKLYFLLETACE